MWIRINISTHRPNFKLSKSKSELSEPTLLNFRIKASVELQTMNSSVN